MNKVMITEAVKKTAVAKATETNLQLGSQIMLNTEELLGIYVAATKEGQLIITVDNSQAEINNPDCELKNGNAAVIVTNCWRPAPVRTVVKTFYQVKLKGSNLAFYESTVKEAAEAMKNSMIEKAGEDSFFIEEETREVAK